MISLVYTEIRKLNGSLALLLAVVAPAFPAMLVMLSVATSDRSSAWSSIFESFMLPIWALFLMPMIVTAFTTLMAQIEYQARGWDHLLALPIRKWQVFAAKALVVLFALVAMTTLALVFTLVGAFLGSLIGGNTLTGQLPLAKLINLSGLMLASAFSFVGLQMWVAFRFSSFVASLSFGIGGTMVALAVAMTGTRQADWFPWVLPMKVLGAADPARFAWLGVAGGLIIFMFMLVDLSRNSFR